MLFDHLMTIFMKDNDVPVIDMILTDIFDLVSLQQIDRKVLVAICNIHNTYTNRRTHSMAVINMVPPA